MFFSLMVGVLNGGSSDIYCGTTCVLFTHSWDVVHTYKVQFSNDSLVWKPCMNGTKEAVSEHVLLLFQHSNSTLIPLSSFVHVSRLHASLSTQVW